MSREVCPNCVVCPNCWGEHPLDADCIPPDDAPVVKGKVDFGMVRLDPVTHEVVETIEYHGTKEGLDEMLRSTTAFPPGQAGKPAP